MSTVFNNFREPPFVIRNSNILSTMSSVGPTEVTSPWGKMNSPAPASLSDVMSEELVDTLQREEVQTNDPEIDMTQLLTSDDLNVSNDMLLAQMMQHEFDKEYDREVQIKEDKLNSQSKVRVSYQNYRAVHPSIQDDVEYSDEEVLERPERQKEHRNFRGKGISGKGKNIVTKHDANMWGQTHADRVIDQFPIEMNTGDTVGMDIKLSNKVYNNLKTHTKTENKRSHRLHEKKEHSTAEHAMDQRTRLILYKLVNNGTLDDVSGIISTGKESVVFHAKGGSGTEEMQKNNKLVPKEVAIKVFKTTLTDFKNRAEYVKGDIRFCSDEFKKKNPRKIMGIWADKEVANLRRMKKFEIPCPEVVQLKKHVLVMQFIGKDRVAAPKVKDANLSVADTQLAYEQCIQYMKKMYRECQLIHADLSEYNMLWYEDTLYFIDVSQAVDRLHPHGHEFLLRDCRNVVQFFKKLGVTGVPSEYDLFNQITELGLQGSGPEFLMQIQEYEKKEEKMRTGTSDMNYPFDFFFEKASNERMTGDENQDDDQEDSDSELSE